MSRHCIKDDGCDGACEGCIDKFLCGVVVHEVYPPIPSRDFDWSAVHAPTYDGADDAKHRNEVGYGQSPAAATDDLIEKAFLC